jgi:nitroreductase
MDIISQLNKRYATKIFDPSKKVSDNDMGKLLEAIRLSASSMGLQPYKVLVVTDPAIRAELRTAAYNQPQITDAAALLVFAANVKADEKSAEDFMALIAGTRNVSTESLSGYSDMVKGTLKGLNPEQLENWVSKQAYIALGFGLVSAAVLGIDSCPMEGFSAPEFDRILDLNKLGLKSAVVMAVGYRSEDDKYQHLAKVRTKNDDFFIKY